ncbi:hypothetical protein TTHERM_00471750 (macronuclear) [Tetrahymena thermophila SB210]|uniref:Uncharacterized protein n=1 Tax=Tetrahymena thermophila (strain SB210) TaxID=312017 RepID=I7MD30_TETTS|nr:hypothetical protein TTHERM_00471750 [Tetrahymena thermophila SB210]EAR85396.2 hypothetical protein TTHERM_00471750 [Tetrahymena thermophila SB210]|eukprot:XP_001033059.2 hypothetical protein TTHERM_00471750 [Tetrahymena thermophila SB210]
MKSSLKKQSNIGSQTLNQKQDQYTKFQQGGIQEFKQNVNQQTKSEIGSFLPFKGRKERSKLRIAQIYSDNIQHKDPQQQPLNQQNGKSLQRQNNQVNPNQVNTQIQSTSAQQQSQENKINLANSNTIPKEYNSNSNDLQVKNNINDQIKVNIIKAPLANTNQNTQDNKKDYESINKQQNIKQCTDGQVKDSFQLLQDNKQKKLNEHNKLDIKKADNSIKEIAKNDQQFPFEYKLQNRRRSSQKSKLDISINKSIAEINEGYQERDLEKEQFDIRKLVKNNQILDKENFQNGQVNKDVEDKIFNPQLSNYKGDRIQDSFTITVHTKYVKQIQITSVINFETVNQIDPELRLYHLLFDLIDNTEKTIQQEYTQCPEFLYYLNVLNNIVKTSFSKIATNRRKSIIIEQQQKVKECLFNKWETSKQRVINQMIEKYLKKYDKFKRIDEKLEQSKEYNYLKRTITGLISQQNSLSIPQKIIYSKIEEQQKLNIQEIEKQKNQALMKPVVDGLELIKKGQEHIIDQQNKMSKSYEKLTKIIFHDWKQIESFDEFAWLQDQTNQTQIQ